jgi:hypothetical protein
LKKLLLTLGLGAALLLGYPDGGEAQEPEKTNFSVVAYDYMNGHGISYGLGFTLGKVSVAPYTRFTTDFEPPSDGLIYDKSVGVEFVYWPEDVFGLPMQGEDWKVGLLASPLDVNWLELQNEPLSEYFAQTGGVVFQYAANEKLGVVAALKGTTQLFDSDSQFKDRLRYILGAYLRY